MIGLMMLLTSIRRSSIKLLTAKKRSQKTKHEAALEEKKMLIVYEEQKIKWVDEQLAEKYDAHTKKVQEKLVELRQKEASAKIGRAKKARTEYEMKATNAKEAEKAEKD